MLVSIGNGSHAFDASASWRRPKNAERSDLRTNSFGGKSDLVGRPISKAI